MLHACHNSSLATDANSSHSTDDSAHFDRERLRAWTVRKYKHLIGAGQKHSRLSALQNWSRKGLRKTLAAVRKRKLLLQPVVEGERAAGSADFWEATVDVSGALEPIKAQDLPDHGAPSDR